MDQITANIEWDSAYNDDPVILIEGDGEQTIACQDLADRASLIFLSTHCHKLEPRGVFSMSVLITPKEAWRSY